MYPDEFIQRKIGSCITLNNRFTGSVDSTNGVALPILEDASLLTSPLGEGPSSELGSKGVYSSGSSEVTL
jgi:hypothetical protein